MMGRRLYKTYVNLTNIIVRLSDGTEEGKKDAHNDNDAKTKAQGRKGMISFYDSEGSDDDASDNDEENGRRRRHHC